MHATCSNCKSKLSCGCQKRTASNGAQCCTMCLGAYEGALKNKINQKTVSTVTTLFVNNKP